MRKELGSLIISPVGAIFLFLFVVVSGCLLWVLPGAYNIGEGGYATMDAFFALVPVLLVVLVPALSMKSFSEEKRSKTLDLLLTRPVSVPYIIASKMSAVFCLVLIAFLLSLSNVYLLSFYALPEGNLDWGAITGSYLGLICFSLSIISFSVFTSSLTSNQILAYIGGVSGSFLLYYGFDLLASLVAGNAAVFIQKWGMLSHVQFMKRGVIESSNLLVLFSYCGLFFLLTHWVVSVRKPSSFTAVMLVLLAALHLSAPLWSWRWDLTAEKRYTLSDSSVRVLKELDAPLEVTSYLDGELNPGFTRLKQTLSDLVQDFKSVASDRISFRSVDPYEVADASAFIRELNDQGVRGVAVNERNRDGGFSQKTIYPYFTVSCGGHSVVVSLLINQVGKSGEENLNASVENLEYALVKAVSDIRHKKENKIAFLEGHGELSEAEVSDITDRLSQYYTIDRGVISGRKGELNGYELIVIAGPQSAFSEQEKFVLDQYLMQGGKLLLLVNGVLLDYQALAQKGETPSMPNNTQLDDMLFHYGLRINPVLVKDLQCMSIPVSVAGEGQDAVIKPVRWPYAPLLNPVAEHPIGKNLLHVKSEFASSIDFTGKAQVLKKTPLLLTSDHSKEVQVPEMICLDLSGNGFDIQEFDKKDLVVAALVEGRFTSVFQHRSIPEGVDHDPIVVAESPETKIIVVASEEIIRNNEGQALGYDPYSQITFGNAEFLVNAVQYLTDDAGLMELRGKHWNLRLLDKKKMQETSSLPVLFALVLPVFLILAGGLIVFLLRKRKYTR